MDLAGKTLMITGIGGFIGHRMVKRATARGLTVRGLELNPDGAEAARANGADYVVVGDVCDPDAVREAIGDADIVFHTAALVSEAGDWLPFIRVNVKGSQNVARVSREHGVRRFIHLSSVMVYGFEYPDHIDEGGPLDGADNPYCQTKIDSEAAVMALHEPGRFEVTAMRPGDVYGPGSQPWVVRPLEMMRKGLFALPDGGEGALNLLYVDNLLDAVFAALERDVSGEAINVTDDADTTAYEYFRRLAALADLPPPRTAPLRILLPVAKSLEWGFRIFGRTPPASADGARFLARKGRYSIAKARRLLGYEPRIDLDEGMRQVRQWYSHHRP